ncbi:HD-GYP domain-containing protein [Clostridium cellulovorans]|uniref:Metal dependent phosphohydrolase n=1 Tax=Clostridium cellulovorans (strain ATCC 35296 / DSM 3052 / OCM 3 / 743B) TaxID=573061 RepID=D9SNE7_CLOC7|nr:HD domain-containing protein [Clostridium cellulovorans]ADL53939.1 metal dependent phosphohydrolase [Clostridium cellulovorans 743B]
MKLVLLNKNLVNKTLANSIYTENGVMFVSKGNIITDSCITKLKRMGFTTVYIEDGNDEVTLQEVLEAPIKLHAIKVLKQIFDDTKRREYVNEVKVLEVVTDIMRNINLSENATMISNLAAKDDISKLAVHSLDVAILAIMVGIRKGYDEKKIMKLGIAALLHDLGKLFIDDKFHVRKAREILKKNPSMMSTTYMAIYYMFEREDGSGLFGLPGEKVHDFAKILGICDEYINDINGKNAMLPHVAIEKITADAVNKFDKEIYKDFVESVYCYPNGLQVRLNNGEKAVVVMQNIGSTIRPILAVKTREQYKFCNLISPENLTLFIEEVILQ